LDRNLSLSSKRKEAVLRMLQLLIILALLKTASFSVIGASISGSSPLALLSSYSFFT
jgi:hypothetical protein